MGDACTDRVDDASDSITIHPSSRCNRIVHDTQSLGDINNTNTTYKLQLIFYSFSTNPPSLCIPILYSFDTMLLISVKKLMECTPFSLCTPESLNPPKGIRESPPPKQLIHTLPASNSRATRCALRTSLVQTLAANPYRT